MKLAFMPISIGAGFLAAAVGKKAFERIWALFDEEEPPDAQHRDIRLVKLAVALLIEGAIFRLVRGLVDHGARRGFARVTGTWPGEEAPES
ncbi:MAG TPA: DUF4235 domain-containing protein [Solirubrobacterales bacterium]|jgi:hypothetical protein|nr:DUF4235 domain-containing protein [Solirubrobacterales bacterium]